MKKVAFIILLLTIILRCEGQNVIRGEYYFNTEPGIGNGTPLNFSPGDSLELDFNIATAGLPGGFNSLYMRFLMETGDWGMLQQKTIFHLPIEESDNIISGEYFFNTEPGVGNGTAMSFPSSDSVVFDVNIGTSALQPGFNHLYMRFKSESGHWGMLNQKTIYVLHPITSDNVVSGEYFIDTEPGVGNGTAFTLDNPVDSLEQNFIFQLPTLAMGSHILYIRYVNENQSWGMLEPHPFNVCETYGAEAIFSSSENANMVVFQNESLQADSILWNFGDNTTSELQSPIHFYSEAGNYNVSLFAHNDCGESTSTQVITIEGLESVQPGIVSNASFSTLSISGFGFIDGTIVKLTREGFDDIIPTGINIISGSTISTVVNFIGAETGYWSLLVEIPGEGIFLLNDAIEVIQESFSASNMDFTQLQIAATRTGRRSPGFGHIQNNNSSDVLAVPVIFRDISDVEHLYYGEISPITQVDFFGESYQFLLDNGIANTVMLAENMDEVTNSKFSSFIIPKVPASASNDLPLFIKRNVSGTHACGAMMLFPQLGGSSQSGILDYQNEFCLSSFVKAGFENATSLSFEESEWNTCFEAWRDSLFSAVVSISLDANISHLPISMPACIVAILTHMSTDGCISNFPSTLTSDQLSSTTSHVLANITFLNDADNVALSCPVIQGMETGSHHEIIIGSNRENEFCELAAEIGGNTLFSSAGMAQHYCRLFGNGVDPNMKYGPGDNENNVFVDPGDLVTYTISFENDTNATAPAEIVDIIDNLDGDRFVAESFRWGPIALSDSIFIQPQSEALHQVILTDLRPAKPFYLMTELDFNLTTLRANWHFSTLDTTNFQPIESLLDGFLPPNDDGTEGIGDVSFFVRYKDNLVTGDTIHNTAEIIFDFNEAIFPPTWTNVIDNSSPTSAVEDLPINMTTETFMVQWNGSDTPAGIANYNVFVSENDGPFLPWIISQDTLQSEFTGTIGNVYKFYSRALDNAGNFESAPEDPWSNYDAITTITTSIDENNEDIALSVYPIPSNDYVTVALTVSQTTEIKFEVLDLTGRQLLISRNLRGKTGHLLETINISNLSSGLYLLEITLNEKKYTTKFIKQ